MSRRDSFITHRSFCDALAEETARVNAASNISNYSIMQNPLGPNMTTQFSSFFKPNSCSDQEPAPGNQTSNKGLSLWMTQTSQAHEAMANNNNLHEFHQLGSVTSPTAIYGTSGNPLASCSNPPPSNYQLNWVFGNKLSSNGSHLAQCHHLLCFFLFSFSLSFTTAQRVFTINLMISYKITFGNGFRWRKIYNLNHYFSNY